MEKLLPQNIEAEQAVLGSVLLDPESMAQVADQLIPDDFYRNAHRLIYAAMSRLYSRRSPADYISLCDELECCGELEDAGGASYLASLLNVVITSGLITYHARIVERTSVLRRLIHAAGQIATSAYEQADAEVVLERAESLIYSIRRHQGNSDFETDTAILDRYADELDALYEKKEQLVGVPTGFGGLDFLTGGLQKSDLIVLAGRPGMGKSSLMLSSAHNAVLKGNRRVAIASCEMSKKQLIARLVSMETGVDLARLRNGKIRESEWPLVVEARARLSTGRLLIDDTGAITLSALMSKVRRLHGRAPIDLLIVDYLQLMRAHSESRKGENRTQEVGEITHGLKALAKELDIPVLALAQLSRAVESRGDKTPQLSDLRESGDIENDADIVLFIYRDDYYNPKTTKRPGTADLIIAKHRNGPTGEVALRFNRTLTLFANMEQEEENYVQPDIDDN